MKISYKILFDWPDIELEFDDIELEFDDKLGSINFLVKYDETFVIPKFHVRFSHHISFFYF